MKEFGSEHLCDVAFVLRIYSHLVICYVTWFVTTQPEEICIFQVDDSNMFCNDTLTQVPP